MEQLFKIRNEKSWRTLLLTETTLQLVNTDYKTIEDFKEKYEEKGFLKKRLEVSVLDISSIRHPKKNGTAVTITYSDKDKHTDLLLNFDSEADRDAFIATVSKPRNMVAGEGKQSRGKAILPSLVGLGITIFFTWIVYEDAWVLEQGGDIDTSGRRSLYKMAFKWLAEQLGTTGSLVAGGAISLVFLYFIYKNLQSPPEEVVYKA